MNGILFGLSCCSRPHRCLSSIPRLALSFSDAHQLPIAFVARTDACTMLLALASTVVCYCAAAALQHAMALLHSDIATTVLKQGSCAVALLNFDHSHHYKYRESILKPANGSRQRHFARAQCLTHPNAVPQQKPTIYLQIMSLFLCPLACSCSDSTT